MTITNCSNTAISEMSKGSNTPPTNTTNLQVAMQHKSGTALIWRDNLGRKAPPPEKKKGGQWGPGGLRADKLADLSWLVWRWGECSREPLAWTSLSIVHRMSMEFESKFLDSLWIKAETLQRNQSVRNVNNTPYT